MTITFEIIICLMQFLYYLIGFFNYLPLNTFDLLKNTIFEDIVDVSMRLFYLADNDQLKCVSMENIKVVDDDINTIKTVTTQ